MNSAHTIGLVDDEPGVLRALQRLLVGEGFEVRPYGSAEELLLSGDVRDLDCLILDVNMPGLDGLELQARLQEDCVSVPVVFLTGTGDIPASVRAIKAGAVDFLTKPVDSSNLLAVIRESIGQYAAVKGEAKELSEQRQRLDRLSDREREVLSHVVSGRLNKQIASELGISEQTIKVHRMHITRKLEVSSVAELVRMTERLGFARFDQ
ncbi:MAG: response regulator transcription factor [Halioglobus sp.]|nr:response regulator transcription factor [Halioglobus sp.]